MHQCKQSIALGVPEVCKVVVETCGQNSNRKMACGVGLVSTQQARNDLMMMVVMMMMMMMVMMTNFLQQTVTSDHQDAIIFLAI